MVEGCTLVSLRSFGPLYLSAKGDDGALYPSTIASPRWKMVARRVLDLAATHASSLVRAPEGVRSVRLSGHVARTTISVS